jgi:hypothetical protein
LPFNLPRSKVPRRNQEPPVFTIHGGELDVEKIQDGNDGRVFNEKNELAYVAIGNLIFGATHQQKANEHVARISIRYRNDGSPNNFCTDYWQLGAEGSSNICAYLAAAETVGCLCRGIVISVSCEYLSDNMEQLDDFLYCIAEGMVRRTKSTEEQAQEVVRVVIRFPNEDKSNCQNIQQYIQRFMDVAMSYARERHKTHDAKMPKVEVSSSSFSHESEVTTDLLLHNLITQADGLPPNLFPHSVFGVLANNMHTSIYKRISLSQNSQIPNPVEWTKVDQMHPHNTEMLKPSVQVTHKISNTPFSVQDTQKISNTPFPTSQLSPGFKQTVEMLMARLFLDAEESLLEIGTRIDDSFFELDNEGSVDTSMPNFGNDFDGVLNAISESFAALVDGDPTLTAFEREWANSKLSSFSLPCRQSVKLLTMKSAQRLVALEQITRTRIHHLYHSHLENLRNYFGQLYGCTLDRLSASKDGTKSLEPQRRDAARCAEEGFTNNAFNSIPRICRHPDGELCDTMSSFYSSVEVLRGLLEDMYEITAARMLEEEEEWDEIMDSSVAGSEPSSQGSSTTLFKQRIGLRQLIKKIREERRKRGPAIWYERWAGKAFIIGLNYLQGWFALQTLRREAIKRDQDMPKFPLF